MSWLTFKVSICLGLRQKPFKYTIQKKHCSYIILEVVKHCKENWKMRTIYKNKQDVRFLLFFTFNIGRQGLSTVFDELPKIQQQ